MEVVKSHLHKRKEKMETWMVSATIIIRDEISDEFENAKRIPIFTMQKDVKNQKEAENNFLAFLENFGIEYHEDWKAERLK